MVVDGSVQQGKAAAAVVDKDDDDTLTRISIPVDGSLKDTNSYRAKLLALYEGYLHTERLIPVPLRPKTKGTIWSDSESSLKKDSLNTK